MKMPFRCWFAIASLLVACGNSNNNPPASDSSDAGGGTDAGWLVLPSDTGHACQEDRDCLSGLCTSLAGSPSACTGACASVADCVAGWSCETTTSGQPPKMCTCVPKSETCNGLDDDCDGVVDNEPAVDKACAESKGRGSVCQAGACSCALMCGNTCVNPDKDLANCGGCGVTCDTCSMGFCGTVIASDLASPTAAVFHGGRLYWTNRGDGSLMSIPPEGGIPQTVVTQYGGGRYLANDSQNLYWTIEQPQPSVPGLVMQVAYDGQGLTTLATDDQEPGIVAVGGGRVWWSNHDSVQSVPIGGGDVTHLVTSSYGYDAMPLAVGPSDVFYPDNYQMSYRLMKIPQAGGTPVPLATIPSNGISQVFLSGADLFWSGDDIASVPLSGGSSRTDVVQSHGLQVAVDADNFYWTNGYTGVLLAPRNGGEMMRIFNGSDLHTVVPSIAIDDKYVYVVDAGCSVEQFGELGCPTTKGRIVRVKIR